MAKKTKNTTEIRLNYDLYKQKSKFLDEKMRKIVNSFVRNCPKEILIEVLKKKGIIKRNWLAGGEEYVEK